MGHLDGVTTDQLQQALDEAAGKKPTQRLMVAIAYKNGVSQTELAEWYDVQRRTIYSWLTRLDDGPLDEAISDDHRSGRPRKLSESQRTQLRETLHQPPADAGYDSPAWTPALVQHHLEETFGVEYSRPSCRRLMKEAGLRYRQPRSTDSRPEAASGDWYRGKKRWLPS